MPPSAVAALKAGDKIEAIKQVRAATGLDLVEAKEMVDAYERAGIPGLPPATRAERGRKHAVPMEAVAAKGLSPGEIPSRGGAWKWVVLLLVAGIVIAGVLYWA